MSSVRSPDPVSESGSVPKFIEDVVVQRYICDRIFIREKERKGNVEI